MYTSDSVLRLPRREGPEDRELLVQTARRVVEIMRECDELPSAERNEHALKRLDELDGGL